MLGWRHISAKQYARVSSWTYNITVEGIAAVMLQIKQTFGWRVRCQYDSIMSHHQWAARRTHIVTRCRRCCLNWIIKRVEIIHKLCVCWGNPMCSSEERFLWINENSRRINKLLRAQRRRQTTTREESVNMKNIVDGQGKGKAKKYSSTSSQEHTYNCYFADESVI